MELKQHNPMHPGEFIRRVYLAPFGIGGNELAVKLQVSPGAVSRLLAGKMNISPAMALKLAKVLGRSPESWMIMQDNYDLWKAREEVDVNALEAMVFPEASDLSPATSPM